MLLSFNSVLTLLFSIFTLLMNHRDWLISRGDWRNIERINYLYLTVLFLFYFMIAFLLFYPSASARTIVTSVFYPLF
ncbi:MAG: PTS sugar transporter subunit IIC [Sodalis sp. (in: enterobacteria)]